MAEQIVTLKPKLRVVQCASCGAACQTTGDACWMCRQKLPVDHEIAVAKVVAPPILAPPKFAPQTFSFSLASVFAVITFVAVGLGLAQIEPGLGMLFGFVCFPAFVITFVRTRAEQRVKGRRVGWGEKILTFALSSVAILGALIIALIALVIALYIVCLFILGLIEGKIMN